MTGPSQALYASCFCMSIKTLRNSQSGLRMSDHSGTLLLALASCPRPDLNVPGIAQVPRQDRMFVALDRHLGPLR